MNKPPVFKAKHNYKCATLFRDFNMNVFLNTDLSRITDTRLDHT